jgi:hypothetical protein
MRSAVVHYILNDHEPWVNDLLIIENLLTFGIDVRYRPLKIGFLFSRKAATASIMSSFGICAAFFWAT